MMSPPTTAIVGPRRHGKSMAIQRHDDVVVDGEYECDVDDDDDDDDDDEIPEGRRDPSRL